MIHKTRGIVLHHIKYGETSVIAYVYTEIFGRQAYLIKGVRSKNSKINVNILQPLFLLDMEVYYRSKRELQRVKEINNHIQFSSTPYNIIKSSIALFLAEILYKTLKEEEPNPSLFEYLDYSIKLLDVKTEGCANFHLSFLLHLTKYLGFFPNNNYSENNRYFDLKNGKFVPARPNHSFFLSPHLSSYFFQLLNHSFKNGDLIQVNYETREELIEKILQYYDLHIEGLGKIKSLKVLKEVFH